MLAGSLGAVGGAALGITGTAWTQRSTTSTAAEAPLATVPVFGRHQAGITRPATPQAFGLLSIGDLADSSDVSFLPALGRRIAKLVASPPADVLPDGPAGLTVTVGVGPRVIRAVDPTLPGAEPLPTFPGDEHVDPVAAGGDLLLAAYANDPTVLLPVVDDLTDLVRGFKLRWQQRCFRGPGRGTIVRNPLSFHDGVTVPRSEQELAEHVWLEGRLAGGTICVVRRLRLDIVGFHALPIAERERVTGRKLDGSPLSGGKPFSDVNLDAKAPDGTYLIPVDAHVRAAHPSFTGSHLMLRRGYTFDNGPADSGLLFISFQRDLRTFVATQHRLVSLDRLMRYVTPTGSGNFLILPGFTAEVPIGHSLLLLSPPISSWRISRRDPSLYQ
jgi:dye decolorizing peroxidase